MTASHDYRMARWNYVVADGSYLISRHDLPVSADYATLDPVVPGADANLPSWASD
jgi:hypothetical protein